MTFLVNMGSQLSSFEQQFSIYNMLPFWNHFALFWVPKWNFYTRLFFGNKQHPNNVKKKFNVYCRPQACNFIKKRGSDTGGFLWILRNF